MSTLPDLFPGFESRYFDTEEGKIFARIGGKGEPLVLLHGFPETHVMWHKVAPKLAKTRQVIVPDLRGYGWSSAPEGAADHSTYAKRAMADDILRMMEALGHTQFALAGHDRGARVAYRLALDHPGRLTKLALLDIVPTITMWERMDARKAMQVYHWSFLAQPAPMPENLISKAPVEWLEHTLASWTKTKDLAAFTKGALAHYRAAFNEPSRIHAFCEDYRAGATRDIDHDEEARAAGQTITCPVLVLWGKAGIPASGSSPLEAWRDFAPDVHGLAIDAGHFLPEENPAETLQALEEFFS